MPTSDDRKKARRATRRPPDEAGELFVLNANHELSDAGLHEDILADGDHAKALSVSQRVMKRLGLTPRQIEAISGVESAVEGGADVAGIE